MLLLYQVAINVALNLYPPPPVQGRGRRVDKGFAGVAGKTLIKK